MTINGWVQIAIYCVLVALFVKPFGVFMHACLRGRAHVPSPCAAACRARGLLVLRRRREAGAALADLHRRACCSSASPGFVTLYALQRFQDVLPFNPQGQSAVEQSSAFNTAVSFVTNTNWQAYGGETTMSYLDADGGAHGAQFRLGGDRHRARASRSSAASRGVRRRRSAISGSISPAARFTSCCRCRSSSALLLIAFGMPQNLGAYTEATTLEGAKQVIAQGPVASQIAIKQLGTNGGGFFNVNSAHPFENPNAVTNFIEMWSDPRHQRGAHLYLRPHGARPAPGLGALRRHGHPVPRRSHDLLLGRVARQSRLRAIPCRSARRAPSQAGGNMEGKEVRFGIANSTHLGDRHDRRVERLGQFDA